MNNQSWVQQSLALFRKDLLAETRTRVAFGAMGVFSFSALLLISLAMVGLKGVMLQNSTGQSVPAWNNSGKMSLLWVLLCFAAFAGLSHSFVYEEETGTASTLKLHMMPQAVYAGKLLFNTTVLLAVSLVITPLYMVMTGMEAGTIPMFFTVMLSGTVSLSAVATVVAALAARARSTGALFGAVGLPMLTVLLVLIMNAARQCYIRSESAVQYVRPVIGIVGFGVLIVTLSALLFHFIWED